MRTENTGLGRGSNFYTPTPYEIAYYGSDPVRTSKLKEREREKFAPNLQKLIYGRKYILPHYRQMDYYATAVADLLFGAALMIPANGVTKFGHVENAAFSNALRAIQCDRPQLWLERELGEALMRTELPEDLVTGDIKWKWPGFRIHIPKGILSIHDNDLMFIDICWMPADEQMGLPEPYLSDLIRLGTELNWVDPKESCSQKTLSFRGDILALSGVLSGPGPIGNKVIVRNKGDYESYAAIKPWSHEIEIVKLVNFYQDDLDEIYATTADDKVFLGKMMHLALNVLLYLSATPLEYDPMRMECLRKPKTEGKRHIPGLYKARFVGSSQLRARREAHLAEVCPSGRRTKAHWVAGYWRRQPFGPQLQNRKLIWIQPYPTGELRHNEELSST